MKAKMRATFDDIMKKFDFDKVHALMLLNKWTWAAEGVPTPGMLRSTACHLFESMVAAFLTSNIDHSRASCGGLNLALHCWSDGQVNLILSFNFESVDYSFRRD